MIVAYSNNHITHYYSSDTVATALYYRCDTTPYYSNDTVPY